MLNEKFKELTEDRERVSKDYSNFRLQDWELTSIARAVLAVAEEIPNKSSEDKELISWAKDYYLKK